MARRQPVSLTCGILKKLRGNMVETNIAGPLDLANHIISTTSTLNFLGCTVHTAQCARQIGHTQTHGIS